MAMDLRKIRKLIELIQETGIAEIEIHEGEESVRISRETSRAVPQIITSAPTTYAVSEAKPSSEAPAPAAIPDHKYSVKAPMVGTVYLSPSPGAKPFITV